MKRFLVLALVAIAGILAAGSSVKANHYRHVGHHGGYGGYRGGYNRGYINYGYRPSYGVSVYRQSYGGYGGYRGGFCR